MKTEDENRSLSFLEVLAGYSTGVFPMGENEDTIEWYEADPRAIIPLDGNGLKISRSLKQTIQKNKFEIKVDTAFEEVIRKCAERYTTWINEIIIGAYTDLHIKGFAHCVEAWYEGKLAGGLYGVSLNSAFFGESMFHTIDDASKVCVVKLYDILKKNNFLLFDIQMITPVFKSFGAVHITKKKYLEMLGKAMEQNSVFIF
jgi:leucyl/phenylalanyl-tRNA--protein transferase